MNAHASVVSAEALTLTRLNVEGMRCAGCIGKIERALGAIDGVAHARVNFSAHRVSVDHRCDLTAATLVAVIEGLGFVAHLASEAQPQLARKASRSLMKALAVSGFAAMNVMLLSVAIWSGADGATRSLFHWLSALIALPAITYAGRPFFASAWSALRKWHTNMDVPISIGVVLTTAMSLYETATNGPHAYFDGALMLLFFLLAGRFLDSTMRARAEDSVAALLRQLPDEVSVLLPDGRCESRSASAIAPGMRIAVAAGERIGADGVVEAGEGHVDLALVTGESAPERVATGARVLAGTIALDAPLTIRVTATGEETVIADIARLMECAGQSKSRYVRVADRAARLYAPAVHSLAALSFVGWMIAGAGLHHSLMIAVAVLIITCPCALGLAVPIAQVVAAGALMRAGILIKDGSALERLAEVDEVLLDKTGTVTLARLAVTGGLPELPDERAALATLARGSRHPLARAIATALEGETGAPLTDISEHPGLGVEAALDGISAWLGRPDWIGVTDPGEGLVTAFRLGDRRARLIRLSDIVRPDAEVAMVRLKALGLAPQLLSGDRPTVVDALARQLGIIGLASQPPRDKFERIERLAGEGRRVLMVGDGLNDGPALKRAHVAMAPATASDVGTLAADLVFLGEKLTAVPVAIEAARRTMTVVRQNFALAIGYNILAVPLAMAGRVTPLIAALAMSGSSAIVVANALRLRGAAR